MIRITPDELLRASARCRLGSFNGMAFKQAAHDAITLDELTTWIAEELANGRKDKGCGPAVNQVLEECLSRLGLVRL